MMRTWAPLVLTLLAGGLLHSSAAEPETVYQWRIFPLPAVSRVLLKLTEQKGSSTIGHSEDVDFSELRGLDRSQTFGAKVVFQIHRDAGTLYCKGGFALGFGEGSVAFVPDPRFVGALREMGFRIAVDDLGAGYAGLTSFTLLEPEIVKLDMTLVRDVHKNSTKQKVIRSMTALSQDMGMTVVAEGVETPEERDTLLDLDCDLLQGFLFARPGKPFPEVKW